MLKEKLNEKGFHLPEGFAVGFSSVVVNPPKGVSMAGYGVASAEVRLTDEIWEDLKMLCTAYSDGENVVLCYTFDSCHIAESVAAPMIALLEEEFGIPESNIIFNAIHTHAAPTMYSSAARFPGAGDYQRNVYHPAVVKAAREAILDLAPATMAVGRKKTEGLSYVRRYILDDGSHKTNPRGADVPVAHESVHDEMMQVVRVYREGKKDIVLVNWQCHPTSAGGEKNTNVCPDWVGILRDCVEAELDVHCIYHQGAAGNIVPSGQLPGENVFKKEAYREHGRLISKVALEILASPMTPVAGGKVQSEKRVLEKAHKEGEGRIVKTPISALSMGGMSYATVPFEMFPKNGQQVKEASPFDVTFVCESTNGDHNYLPDKDAFPFGGYEVRISPFCAGAGEEIAEELSSMLRRQYANR